MPDWTYRTLFRPLLFRLPTRLGRDLALAAIGGVGRLPGGRFVIEFMGHMRPPRPLHRRLGATAIDSPIGLAPGIDPLLVGLPGVCRLGFGFVEIGPVTVEPQPERRTLRDDDAETIRSEPADANPGLAAVSRALERLEQPHPAVIVRLARAATAADDDRVIEALAGRAAAFALPIPVGPEAATTAAWAERVRRAVEHAAGRPVLAVVPANAAPDALAAVEEAWAAGAAGVVVGRPEFPDHAEMGRCWLAAAQAWTRRLRESIGPDACVIAAAGVHAPGDAEALVADGADLVAIDSGLVFTGPGLAKRCNELLLLDALAAASDDRDADPTVAVREKWPWLLLLGGSMLLGGVMAVVIACTRVIMPYDEAMSGLTRELIAGVSPRLLPFMTHDRVSLSGAMLGVGILFAGLAWCGARCGQHWAERAVILPAGVGFLSFFSFLGFGYFDPLHAFVTTILFQLLLLAIVGRPSRLAAVGYDSIRHLAPAYGGLAFLWLAAAASHGFLCGRPDLRRAGRR